MPALLFSAAGTGSPVKGSCSFAGVRDCLRDCIPATLCDSLSFVFPFRALDGLDFGGVAAISLFSWGGGHTSGAKNQFYVTSFAPHAFVSYIGGERSNHELPTHHHGRQ